MVTVFDVLMDLMPVDVTLVRITRDGQLVAGGRWFTDRILKHGKEAVSTVEVKDGIISIELKED